MFSSLAGPATGKAVTTGFLLSVSSLPGNAPLRFAMLRLIREGAIAGCVDIARAVALDDSADPHHRIGAKKISVGFTRI
jgi:hypothetical protein